MITTSGFTTNLMKMVVKKLHNFNYRVSAICLAHQLVDGRELAELMIENNVGVWAVSCYEIKRIDEKYFEACCV